jgi:hypothetical protein
MWRELTDLWQSVRDPQYAHLLLESLPLYGLGIGLTFLIVAFLAGEKRTRLLALAVIALSCASVWPYLSFLLEATPRILATRPVSFGEMIEKQTQLRQDTAWVYYAMVAICVLAMALTKSRYARHGVLAVVVGGVLTFWMSVWLHKKECEVYHPNITLPQASRR